MNYRLKLLLNLFNQNRTNHISGSTEVNLPFAPYPGLHINFGDYLNLCVVKVAWKVDEECFYCVVEDGCSYDFSLNSDISDLINDIEPIEEAMKLGWEGFKKVYRSR